MPWLAAPIVTAASPVSTPGARLDARSRAWERGDEVQRRADGALGVVLVGDGCAPDRHHRIADELLDRAAVPADDVARELEVAGQRLADVLGIAALRERREPDEVGEQDRDEAPLGDRRGVSAAAPSSFAGAGVGRAEPQTRPRRPARSRTRHRTSRPACSAFRNSGR